MKKLLTALLAAVAAVTVCLSFAACDKGGDNGEQNGEAGQPIVTGSYELLSATAIVNDTAYDTYYGMVYTVGDLVPAEYLGNAEAMTLTADYMTLEVKENGAFVMTTKYDMYGNPVYNGTWTQDGDTITFNVPGDAAYNVTLKDNTLTMSVLREEYGVVDTTVFIRVIG